MIERCRPIEKYVHVLHHICTQWLVGTGATASTRRGTDVCGSDEVWWKPRLQDSGHLCRLFIFFLSSTATPRSLDQLKVLLEDEISFSPKACQQKEAGSSLCVDCWNQKTQWTRTSRLWGLDLQLKLKISSHLGGLWTPVLYCVSFTRFVCNPGFMRHRWRTRWRKRVSLLVLGSLRMSWTEMRRCLKGLTSPSDDNLSTSSHFVYEIQRNLNLFKRKRYKIVSKLRSMHFRGSSPSWLSLNALKTPKMSEREGKQIQL